MNRFSWISWYLFYGVLMLAGTPGLVINIPPSYLLSMSQLASTAGGKLTMHVPLRSGKRQQAEALVGYRAHSLVVDDPHATHAYGAVTGRLSMKEPG